MKIISYLGGGTKEEQLQFPEIKFFKVNLIVGDSGTGKTRLLNTIFNAGRMAVNTNQFFEGWWNILFEHEGIKFRWELDTVNDDNVEEKIIKKEKLSIYENNDEKIIVNRTEDSFFFNDDKLPKLSGRETSIVLLKNEDAIKPIYDAFKFIIRRNFSGSDLEEATIMAPLSQPQINKIKKHRNKDEIFHKITNVNSRMYLFENYFKEIYTKICDEFISIFPFVKELKILDAEYFGLSFPGIVPVFSLKEKEGNKWIALHNFSSGMKKVLLILTDIFVLPMTGAVYLIDEYENSLGMSAINFFPDILFESDTPSQFIITSHHPYIIGNVPVRDWIVLNRKGLKVFVKQGVELEDRYGKSKQKSFIQLINDPFFTGGVE